MSEDSLRTAYNADGYHLAKSLFEADEVEEVRRDAKTIFNVQLDRHGLSCADLDDDVEFSRNVRQLFDQHYDAFLGAAKQCQHLISLHRLAFDPRVLDTLTGTLGVEIPTICVKPIIFFNSRHLAKIEGHYKTPAHQDWRSMQGSLDSVVVWVALMDIDEDLGALEIVPGSHLFGLVDTVEDEWFRKISDPRVTDDQFKTVAVDAGDVLFFSSLLVHRSGNNVTDAIRWSVHVRYNNALEESFIDRNFPHPYAVYHPQQDLLNDESPTPAVMSGVFQHAENR